MRYLIPLILISLLFSCTTKKAPEDVVHPILQPTPACPVAVNLAEHTHLSIAKAFDCKDTLAVKQGIINLLAKTKLCSGTTQQAPEFLCEFIAGKARDYLSEFVFPEDWECSGGYWGESFERLFIKYCVDGMLD